MIPCHNVNRHRPLSHPAEASLRDLSRAAQFLCYCASPAPTPSWTQHIAASVAAGIDWETVFEQAIQQEIVPQVYRKLTALTPQNMPGTLFSAFRTQYHAQIRHNLVLTGALIHLLQLLETHGIPALIYKGPAVALMAYGNPVSRQFCDLDLLVHKKDLRRIAGILSAEGYVGEESGWNFFRDRWHRWNDCEYHFLKKPENIYLEIHWRFFENHIRFPLDMAAVWKDAREILLQGHPIRTLSREHTLLTLCIHGGGKHQWSNLKMISDFAALLSREQDNLDREKLRRDIDRLGIRRLWHTGLLLARRLLGTRLPGEFSGSAEADSHARQLCETVVADLFRPPGERAARPGRGLARTVFYMQSRERSRDKIPHFRYLLRDIFHPTDKEKQILSLPPQLSFVHRILRPLRLMAKYSRLLLQSKNHSKPGT